MKIVIMWLAVMLITTSAFATLKYPVGADTDEKKMEFAFIAEEKLRLHHNMMGAKFKNGEITKAEWQTYLKEEYKPRWRVIVEALSSTENKLHKSVKWEVDLDDLTDNLNSYRDVAIVSP